jgi:hypothetical protein
MLQQAIAHRRGSPVQRLHWPKVQRCHVIIILIIPFIQLDILLPSLPAASAPLPLLATGQPVLRRLAARRPHRAARQRRYRLTTATN